MGGCTRAGAANLNMVCVEGWCGVVMVVNDGVRRVVRGPCEGCGFSFRVAESRARPRCPNCGHRGCFVASREGGETGRRIRVRFGSSGGVAVFGVDVPWPVN